MFSKRWLNKINLHLLKIRGGTDIKYLEGSLNGILDMAKGHVDSLIKGGELVQMSGLRRGRGDVFIGNNREKDFCGY